MNADQILNEIREANLSYLMLAQSLIRSDREQALYRLGISEESAALIGLLTPAQMMKIAAGNTLLCRFRMDDDMVWGLLTNHGKSAANDSTSPPARLDPDGRPAPRGGLRPCARTSRSSPKPSRSSRAVALIQLGARLQVLESETDLSYERLLRLYKEVAGKSPSKGQLPFSTDWFMTWQPNIHASLFLNIHEYLNKSSELDEIDAVIKAYQLYQEQTHGPGPRVAAVGDPRLAPGEVRRQRHADDDQVLAAAAASSSPIRTRSPSTTSAACAARRPAPARARPPAVDPDALN